MSVRCTDSCSGSSASNRNPVCSAASTAPPARCAASGPGQGLQGQLAQPLPLAHQPLLERRLLQGEPVE